LYNVPSRTGSNLDAETTLSLAHDFKNIIGIKEASGNFEKAMKIIQHRPKDFLVISGDDAITLPLLACGADGVISVIANAFPKDFSEMVRVGLEGNFEKARKLHYKLTEITHAIFVDGNPSGIKGLLTILNVCSEHVRLPLMSVGKSTMNKFDTILKA
jgi:4-hydroxy-tetrahydrodipicolinate synthase